jgi:hypothetical protein
LESVDGVESVGWEPGASLRRPRPAPGYSTTEEEEQDLICNDNGHHKAMLKI